MTLSALLAEAAKPHLPSGRLVCVAVTAIVIVAYILTRGKK